MSIDAKKVDLSQFYFLNPSFVRAHESAEYWEDHRASAMVLMAKDLLQTTRAAFVNGTMAKPLDFRGIETSLQVAIAIPSDLMGGVEELESDLNELRAKRE